MCPPLWLSSPAGCGTRMMLARVPEIQREAAVVTRETRDGRHHRCAFCERQEREPVRRPLRMEGHAEQSAFGIRVDGHRREIARRRDVRGVLEHAHRSALLNHEPARVVAGRLQHRERLIERKPAEHALRLNRGATARRLRGRDAGEVRGSRVEADRRRPVAGVGVAAGCRPPHQTSYGTLLARTVKR